MQTTVKRNVGNNPEVERQPSEGYGSQFQIVNPGWLSTQNILYGIGDHVAAR
jgi:hypothetical protein